jgi:hypothetical protein
MGSRQLRLPAREQVTLIVADRPMVRIRALHRRISQKRRQQRLSAPTPTAEAIVTGRDSTLES